MAHHPAHHARPKRRYPRASIVAQVEIYVRERIGPPIIGRIENLSAGGMLAACRESLEPQTELAMRFNLPSGRSIQAFGRVIYAMPGGRYGVEFTDLDRDVLQEVEQFAHKVLGYTRRSSRVPHRATLVIRDSKDSADVEVAETVLVSRNGGLLVCRGAYTHGQEIYLWSPGRNRVVRARIVFLQVWANDTVVELGFEFTGGAEFWDIPFTDEGSPE